MHTNVKLSKEISFNIEEVNMKSSQKNKDFQTALGSSLKFDLIVSKRVPKKVLKAFKNGV